MAVNLTKTIATAKVLAVSHIIVGFLLVCFGIRDYVLETVTGRFLYMGIWSGIWVIITGGLGIPGTRKEPSTSRNTFAGVFMGFSIASAVLGVLIAICFGLSFLLSIPKMGIAVIFIILGIIESVIGVWAAVCLCLMDPCTCCCTPAQQAFSGVPVALLRPTGGGIVALQTFTPNEKDNQPQIVQSPAPPYDAVVSTYPETLRQVDMPPSYKEVARKKMGNLCLSV